MNHAADIIADARAIPKEELVMCGQILSAPQEKEESLGVVPEASRPLYGLMNRLGQEHGTLRVKMHHQPQDPGDAYRLAYLVGRWKSAETMFWYDLRTEMQLWGEGFESLGLRRDWVIVRAEPQDPRQLPQNAAKHLKEQFGIEFRITRPESEGEDPED